MPMIFKSVLAYKRLTYEALDKAVKRVSYSH